MGNITRRNRRTPNLRKNSLFGDDFFNNIFSDWDPFSLDVVERKRSYYTSGGYPINVEKTDEGLTYQVVMPGLSKSDINVEATEGRLMVSTNTKSGNESESGNFILREFEIAKSTQTFYLPENANVDKISVSYDAGVLTLSVPQSQTDTVTRKIKIS